MFNFGCQQNGKKLDLVEFAGVDLTPNIGIQLMRPIKPNVGKWPNLEGPTRSDVAGIRINNYRVA